jgi:hypothetical protein
MPVCVTHVAAVPGIPAACVKQSLEHRPSRMFAWIAVKIKNQFLRFGAF